MKPTLLNSLYVQFNGSFYLFQIINLGMNRNNYHYVLGTLVSYLFVHVSH